MSKFEIEISAVFDTHDQAVKALADAEEAVGKCDGEVIDSCVIEDEDDA